MKLRMQLLYLMVSITYLPLFMLNSCSSQQEDGLYEQSDENESQEDYSNDSGDESESSGVQDEISNAYEPQGELASGGNEGFIDNYGSGSLNGGVVSGVAGTPAAPGLPELGAKMSYVVVQGDSLGGISTKIYGTKSKASELAANSGLSLEDPIFPGDIIYYQLSQDSIPFASQYESLAMQEVIIKKGDTLSKIAYQFYGSYKKWKGIWRVNSQIKNPDEIIVGQKINVITKEALASLENIHSNKVLVENKKTKENGNEASREVANTFDAQLTNEADVLGKKLDDGQVAKAAANTVDESFLLDMDLDLETNLFDEDVENMKVSKLQNWEVEIPNWGV